MGGLSPEPVVLRAWEEVSGLWASCLREAELAEGSQDLGQIELDLEHTIRGRALGVSPPATVMLTARARAHRDRGSRTTAIGRDGSFVFPGCVPGQEYHIGLFLPGSTMPCTAGSVWPGPEEQELLPREGTWKTREIVIAFESQDPAHMPILVEMRRYLGSIVVPVDPRLGQATFHGLPTTDYLMLAWIPGLGGWSMGKVIVAPGGPEVPEPHRVTVPGTGRVVFDVQWPGRGRVEGGVIMPAFNHFGFGALGRPQLLKELRGDAEGRFETELLPGDYDYHFSCDGAADATGEFRIEEGAEVVQRVVLAPGIEVELELLVPRSLLPTEAVVMKARTATGRTTRIAATDVVRAHLIRIPIDTGELIASTKFGLEGSCAVPPPEDLADGERPRIVLELFEQK